MQPHQRFGLEYNPFFKNDNKDTLIETKDYKEATARLNILLNMRGFGLLMGEPGKGKTTIVRNWSKQLSKSNYKVIYISLSTVTVLQFYQQLAMGLGIEPTNKKSTNFKNIQNHIRSLSIDKREVPVIILDEANYMISAILNDLKMIFNFNMDSRDHAVILLVGLPVIKSTLDLKSNEPLKQRITINYQVDGLNKDEAKDYIKDKVIKARGNVSMFDEPALEAIVGHSNGVIRLIDKLCNACLIIGASLNENVITSEIVFNAIEEVEL